ncbi:PTS sugar transporter subunit IIA [Heyndrickxia ginsengihumi]|uniref:PTS glucose transporter subunit IIA n=1 Tax=Heyndrickxia ginsengihumi TaxID=363870 RepID=A0A0A6VAZ9_9BACI|nr:PTS glucose transporter subunit IIA [Heyndrickxia ginsengihumi]KHD85410.1 PTS glucose transporter subunit IIA [Heyndrickxia ginsengihumi]MBE6184596.1 PTS glucose transporter subunit IIA [Bacillus sp. (in: firmicutes)]MCM3024885.1 PTS glucose transporter subunit IIA [Heyndrickxia ginsengihumi]NEY19089.1 PTS glucose transporter subunit IIA [Heyndrickxia ginsengihumi]
MFRKWFGRNNDSKDTLTVIAPISGKVTKLEDVPDPVFSEKMMGDGIAIDPVEGKILSPVEGRIVQIFPTKHAIGIQAKNGVELLIHIGLETVSLNGEGFNIYVSEGEKVKQGDLLVTFNLNFIKANANSSVTPIVITNSNEMESIILQAANEVKAGEDPLLTINK